MMDYAETCFLCLEEEVVAESDEECPECGGAFCPLHGKICKRCEECVCDDCFVGHKDSCRGERP